MAEERRNVGIVVARRCLGGSWQSHQWLPTAILPAAPDAASWTRLGATETDETYYVGPIELVLHASETSHYRDNLLAERPSIWVVLRPGPNDVVEVVHATADPYEGEALADSVGDVVEAVPMPAEVRDWIARFFGTHHVEREFFKRRRDQFDPERPGHEGSSRVGAAEPED
jgi:hypothetical protein